MIKLVVPLLLIFLSACSYRPDPWRKQDTYAHILFTGLMVVDWQQTREIADKPDEYHEHNAILGRHPTMRKVDGYFAASYLALTGLAIVLPHKPRTVFYGISCTVEMYCVGNNFAIGLNGKW